MFWKVFRLFDKDQETATIIKEEIMENKKIIELCEKIAEIMEKYNMKVYDFEFINELIEKTIERNEKECSY